MNPLEKLEKLIPTGDLVEQTVKSGFWLAAINVADRGLQMMKLLILASLLSPADFGLMGIAMLSLAALQQFSQLGFDAALIQRRESDVDQYLNTAWVMKFGRGLIIAIIAFIGAPAIARFFGEPRATDLIRVIAISPVILGFQNPGVMYLQKDLDFHREFVYKISGTLVNVSIAIVFGFLYRNVWALVFGLIAGNATMATVSYLIHGYRPTIEFNWDFARELFGYGKWITLSGIVLFLISQGDDAFVGWFLGASALGFYQLAYRLSNAPATEITHVISGVIFPAYSQLQDDVDSLREAYYNTVQLSTLVSFPMGVGIIVVAPTFVQAFLGTKWMPMVPAMQVLGGWGIIRSLGATVGPLFRAVGRPDYDTKLQIFKLILISIFIYPATAKWGIVGTALVIVGNSIISNPIADYLAIRQVEGSVSKFVELIAYPALGSALMGVSVYIFQITHHMESKIVKFLLLVSIGVIIYTIYIIMASHFGYNIDKIYIKIRGSFA